MKRKVTQNELKILKGPDGSLGTVTDLTYARIYGLIPRPELDMSPLTDVEFDFPEEDPLPPSFSKEMRPERKTEGSL